MKKFMAACVCGVAIFGLPLSLHPCRVILSNEFAIFALELRFYQNGFSLVKIV